MLDTELSSADEFMAQAHLASQVTGPLQSIPFVKDLSDYSSATSKIREKAEYFSNIVAPLLGQRSNATHNTNAETVFQSTHQDIRNKAILVARSYKSALENHEQRKNRITEKTKPIKDYLRTYDVYVAPNFETTFSHNSSLTNLEKLPRNLINCLISEHKKLTDLEDELWELEVDQTHTQDPVEFLNEIRRTLRVSRNVFNRAQERFTHDLASNTLENI